MCRETNKDQKDHFIDLSKIYNESSCEEREEHEEQKGELSRQALDRQ